ncbi:hypothetical protein MM560_G66n321 [Manis javanica]|nr:hypothetical protein MM560_G66n321 [Manis javanica]
MPDFPRIEGLKNVPDAHNKIQEESDMWKIRELERQMEDAYRGTKRKMSPSSSSRMRSDGFDEESQRDYWRPKNEISGALEDDFLKAKSWNKKLYDYEANMPDRWGHSGYKELYPEEFETDSDQQDITNGKKKSPQIKPSSHESHKHKKSKKSHKKKQKKKSRKKQKKSKKEATDVTADSSRKQSITKRRLVEYKWIFSLWQEYQVTYHSFLLSLCGPKLGNSRLLGSVLPPTGHEVRSSTKRDGSSLKLT